MELSNATPASTHKTKEVNISSEACEINFDGLVGPTHHYGGLGLGNLPSQKFKGIISNPKQSALEGLEKMKFLLDQAIPQGIIPPQERPDIRKMRQLLDLSGPDPVVLEKAFGQNVKVFSACCSSSSMWAANMATFSPSMDSKDKLFHITPANLTSQLHRSLETDQTAKILKNIFSGDKFVHHKPLANKINDEGAANHLRMFEDAEKSGIQIFVYNKKGDANNSGRQTFQACESHIKNHRLIESQCVVVQQNPEAVRAGVFHNDVISTSHRNLLWAHEKSFVNGQDILKEIKNKFEKATGSPPIIVEVKESDVPLVDVVSSFMFNSQLIDVDPGKMLIYAPYECKDNPLVNKYLQDLLLKDNPISQVSFVNLRQSMQNGGGPACLRIRAHLKVQEIALVDPRFLVTPEKITLLKEWVSAHYRDELELPDMRDPRFLQETRRCLDELTQLMDWGSIYGFQADGNLIIH